MTAHRQRIPVAARLLPSFTDLAFLMPIAFLFIHLRGAKTLLGDGDTGWHIRTGDWILSHHAVPRVDLFSFSKPGQPWFAWEWLWDVTFALIHHSYGLTGVILINIALLGLIFVLLFRLVQRQTQNDVSAISLTMLAMAASSIHWLARPHLAGWLLLLIFCTILQRDRTAETRLFWLLPLITVVWTNVHGSFFIGPALLAAYAAGALIESFLWGTAPGGARRPGFMALLCSLATLVNPYGTGLHTHVVTYLLDSKQLENIGEYQSISFHAAGAVYFEAVLFLGLFAVCWCAAQRRIADALIVGAWAHLALMSCRNIAIFAFFAAPVAAGMIQWAVTRGALNSGASALQRLAGAVRDLGLDHRVFERAWRFHTAPVLAMAVLTFLFAAPSRPDAFRAEYDAHSYPAAALKVLESKPDSRIFTDDEWGDYLIYQLYPRYRVFIDGRSDYYGAEMDNQLLQVLNAHYDWASTLARYSVDTILLRTDSPLAGVLKESRRWPLVYDDGVATIFRSASGEKSDAVPTYLQAGLRPRDRPR